MSKKTDYKSSLLYLERMVEACEKILEYTAATDYESFSKKKRDFDAICMQFSVLGEQVSQIEKHKDNIHQHFADEVDWPGIKAVRNKIDHIYFSVDPEKIWQFANEEIEDTLNSLKRILKKRYGR